MRVVTLVCLLGLAAGTVRAEESLDVRERRVVVGEAVGQTAPVQPLPPGAVVEQYKVNAQYRGGVKKGFSDIGRGTAVFVPQEGARFWVKLDGTVENPENKEQYTFWLDMEFQQTAAGSIKVLRNGSRYSSRAIEYRERIEKVVPFVYLAKFTQLPGADAEPSRAYRFAGVDYVMRYVPTERHVEASLYEGDALVGKFFLLKGDRLPLTFEKFRVPTEGNVVLSFIRL
jgi:hypothetical protein